ncbi:hypothetical protein PAPYR_5960 [Paratrimastix pyriformis]|uniref:Uncharacterized protein n=1 Tax=Paratrimastix pyriformis TaxID=342808 RepID=A0ABQ8ULC9_9EUKA|nr:hypothetical protein PAPYR_5960 [Paratrimastix pyriformis]
MSFGVLPELSGRFHIASALGLAAPSATGASQPSLHAPLHLLPELTEPEPPPYLYLPPPLFLPRHCW